MKRSKKAKERSSKRPRREDAAIDPAMAGTAVGRGDHSVDGGSPAPSAVRRSVVSTSQVEAVATTATPPASESPVDIALPALPKNAAAATRPIVAGPCPVVPSSAGTRTSLRSGAEQIVKEHLPLAVGAGMIPIPGVDLAAVGGLQLKILASLAKHYDVPFTQARAQSIVTSLLGSVGTTLLAGVVLGSVAKFVPFFGAAVGAASMPVAAGVITHAMGHLAIDHFERGGTIGTFDLDVARTAFLHKIAEAKSALA